MKQMSLYDQIMRFEPFDDLDALFSDLDSFEEVSLVSRSERVEQAEQRLGSTNISEFLLGLAVYLINSIRFTKAGHAGRPAMIAITYTDLDEGYANRTLVPNIFVYPGSGGQDLHQTLKDKHHEGTSPEMDTVRGIFKRCGLEESFSFFESRFHDEACGEEIVRIYALPKA